MPGLSHSAASSAGGRRGTSVHRKPLRALLSPAGVRSLSRVSVSAFGNEPREKAILYQDYFYTDGGVTDTAAENVNEDRGWEAFPLLCRRCDDLRVGLPSSLGPDRDRKAESPAGPDACPRTAPSTVTR